MTARRPVIGLALGSGGARGWCHIGVIRALEELGIRPDVVAGTSMGALVGAAYVGGGLDALERWGRALTRRSFMALVDVRLASGGLVEGREIIRLIEALNLPRDIPDLGRPFIAVASDLSNGREIWLRTGAVADAVRASVAMPGIISPWFHQDRWLLDGGVTNPVPVSACRAMGAEVIIAVNPNAKPDGHFWPDAATEAGYGLATVRDWLPEPVSELLSSVGRDRQPRPSYIDVISVAIEIMTEQIRRSRMAGEPPQVLLNADLSRMTVLDFHLAAAAIADGRRIVSEQASHLTRICGVA